MWESLNAIAKLEGCSVNDLCTRIDKQKQLRENLSSAIRVFVMKHYRDKGTQEVPARAAEGWEKKVTINQKDVGDTDALDRLSLSMFPLSSARLKSSRLFKNTRLETMVELHNSEASGSMQIRPRDIVGMFPGDKKDEAIIAKLAALPSFDVYSLRASLRALGIEVAPENLELSGVMKEMLTQYSQKFTLPLILNIFGNDGSIDKGDLMKAIQDPDVARVQERLKAMSQKTGIPVEEIPAFLREYEDIFLSAAYYRHNLEGISPRLNRCAAWLAKLQKQREVVASPSTRASCRNVMRYMGFLSTSARERLGRFTTGFELFWKDMNQESFKKLVVDIEENHAGTGAVLCGLTVKVSGWAKKFPRKDIGGPAESIIYAMTEMEPGLEELVANEQQALRERCALTTH